MLEVAALWRVGVSSLLEVPLRADSERCVYGFKQRHVMINARPLADQSHLNASRNALLPSAFAKRTYGRTGLSIDKSADLGMK